MTSRLVTWLALLSLALPLLGAGVGLEAPSVVVYPITTTGSADDAAGGNVALLIATRLTQLGDIAVKAATPGTDRTKFLSAANALGADYYVTGFLTPLGVDNSLVLQVVSTETGSVVYSTTASVRTYADAVAQAETLRAAILHHAGRALATIDAQPEPTADSGAAHDGSLNLTKALRRRTRATPASTPMPSAAASAAPTPAAVGLLFRASGKLDDRTRAAATVAIARALGRVALPIVTLDVELGDRLAAARAICSTTPGAVALYAAMASVGANVGLDVTEYACNGRILGSARALARTRGRGGLASALDATASTIAAKLPKPGP